MLNVAMNVKRLYSGSDVMTRSTDTASGSGCKLNIDVTSCSRVSNLTSKTPKTYASAYDIYVDESYENAS